MKEEVEKEGGLRDRFKIRLLFPRTRGYLQILQRYRTYAYALPRRFRPGLDKEN